MEYDNNIVSMDSNDINEKKENNSDITDNSFVDVAKKKKRKPLVALNTILCMILLFIVTLVLISSISLRSIFTKNILADEVNKMDVKDLSEFVYSYITDSRIDKENIENVITEADVIGFISENVDNYSGYMINRKNKNMEFITADVIVNYIEENKEIIRKETHLKYVEADKEQIRNDIEKPVTDFNTKLKNNSGWINSVLSVPFIVLMAIIMALIFAQWCFIYIKNCVSLIRLFKIYGITVLVPAVIFGLAALFMKLILKAALADKYEFIIGSVGGIKEIFLINSGIFIIIGLFMAVISVAMSMISGAFSSRKTRKSTLLPAETASQISVPVSAETNINHTVTESAAMGSGQQDETDNNANEKKYRFCTNCGNKLYKNAAFCDKCGQKMN